jgi:PhnB protein
MGKAVAFLQDVSRRRGKTQDMTTNTVNPIPDGYHSLNPFLAVPDGPKAIEFYQQVFGAEVISRQDLPDGKVAQAELKFGDSMLQLSDELPQIGLRAPNREWVHSSLVHYVPDVDATVQKAIEAGARQVEPVSTFVTGDRYGTVIDPFGHRWAIMTKVEDVSKEEADRRIREWLAANAEALSQD